MNDFLFLLASQQAIIAITFTQQVGPPNPTAVIQRTRCAFKTESIRAARGRITVCSCNCLIAELVSHRARKHCAQVQCFQSGNDCVYQQPHSRSQAARPTGEEIITIKYVFTIDRE